VEPNIEACSRIVGTTVCNGCRLGTQTAGQPQQEGNQEMGNYDSLHHEFILIKLNYKGTLIKGGVEIIGVAVLQNRVAFLQKYELPHPTTGFTSRTQPNEKSTGRTSKKSPFHRRKGRVVITA
jgi:hypothetical protein